MLGARIMSHDTDVEDDEKIYYSNIVRPKITGRLGGLHAATHNSPTENKM